MCSLLDLHMETVEDNIGYAIAYSKAKAQYSVPWLPDTSYHDTLA